MMMVKSMKRSNLRRVAQLALASFLSLHVSLNCCLTESQAQSHLQSWNTLKHEKAQQLVSAAMTALSRGLLDQASSLLLQASNMDPGDPTALSLLGMTYVREGKGAQALEILSKAYQQKHSAETLLSTGFAYYIQHDYDAAIASWQKAIQRDRNMMEVYGNMGFAYLRKGDFVAADENFRILSKARPSSQLAYQGLAVLNYLSGNFSAARKAAEHAQSIQSYFPVLLLLAKLDYLQGDPQAGQKRVSEWQRAATGKRALVRSMTSLGYPVQHDFRWDPFLQDNFDNGRMLLARVKSKGKSKSASTSRSKRSSKKSKATDLLSQAKQAQLANQGDFYLGRELGLIELAEGDFEAAEQDFRNVLKLCPSCVVDWLHLARALSVQGQTAEASYAVREFQRLRPSEKIAPSFSDLAKGEPALVPEMSPQLDNKIKPRKEGDSGF